MVLGAGSVQRVRGQLRHANEVGTLRYVRRGQHLRILPPHSSFMGARSRRGRRPLTPVSLGGKSQGRHFPHPASHACSFVVEVKAAPSCADATGRHFQLNPGVVPCPALPPLRPARASDYRFLQGVAPWCPCGESSSKRKPWVQASNTRKWNRGEFFSGGAGSGAPALAEITAASQPRHAGRGSTGR